MCGIAGIINFDGRAVHLEELRAMTDRMVRRGPDDEGFYQAGPVGLGMRRLSIIDVGGGRQPITNEDGTLQVVMNGEIYNFIELREQLKRRGHIFKTDSDTEVILHLYEEKGVKALDDLNGMFGFALWDGRRSALWVARDRLGIKPVYLYRTNRRLTFASDLNALRGLLDLQLNRDAFLAYVALAYVPSPKTTYSGVEKLPPAHFLWIEDGRMEQRRYWDVPAVGTWRGTAGEAQEQLRALLDDAVKLQLRSDVPLGIFLSGGLDSSTILALAANRVTEPLRTLTIEFNGKGSADARFARTAAERHQARYLEVSIGVAEATQALDELLPRLDEPIGDSAIVPSYLLSKLAHQSGLKVLLTGAGGDEIFGGYLRHWRARRGSPMWIAETLPALLRQLVGALWSLRRPDRGMRASDPILAWGTAISGVNLHACRCLLRDPRSFQTIIAAMHDEFGALPTAERAYGRAYGRMGTDLRKYLVEDVLAINDKTTMAASVEGRVPLLDHRLVEFAFGLPPGINLIGNRPKGLLRRAMAADLPSHLLNRDKDGFNAPMHIWLEKDNGMDVAAELLDAPVPLIDEMIDPTALRLLLGKPNWRSKAGETLFSLFLFNRWCRLRDA